MSACAPRLNPFDWISVASWPSSSSLWNPALNFVWSYGLSSTSASALSMKRFCRRSYRRPTIAVSPMLRPEYEYDPSAKPVSLNPANEVSRWFTAAGAGGRSEEHTSELQSQSNLVCRLLLEKKKKKQNT